MAKKYTISQLIAENIISDKMEWIPTDRTRFFMMLLASVANSVAVDERGMSFMRCTYRSSIDKTENTQYQDIFDVTEDDTYVYLRYSSSISNFLYFFSLWFFIFSASLILPFNRFVYLLLALLRTWSATILSLK